MCEEEEGKGKPFLQLALPSSLPGDRRGTSQGARDTVCEAWCLHPFTNRTLSKVKLFSFLEYFHVCLLSSGLDVLVTALQSIRQNLLTPCPQSENYYLTELN